MAPPPSESSLSLAGWPAGHTRTSECTRGGREKTTQGSGSDSEVADIINSASTPPMMVLKPPRSARPTAILT